jgi:signal transduction histidine kinase
MKKTRVQSLLEKAFSAARKKDNTMEADKKLGILLVEDNPGDAYLIRTILRSIPYIDITGVENLEAALEQLERQPMDIILLDLSLPDSQGLDTVRRSVAQFPMLPIIVLTGLDDEILALEALKAGAQDYMVKGPVEPEILMRSIRYSMERKKAEEELNRHREHLEELVKERTWELEVRNEQLHEEIIQRRQAEEEKKKLEHQLIQSQKMEALGRFAGGIAHDLNNILYPILINTQMLLDETPSGSPIHQTLELSLKSIYRQRDLIRQILSFSRRDNQQFNPVKVKPLIKETVTMLRSLIPSTVKIKQSIDGYRDTVLGDPTQIQQIILNLCKNAADAMASQKGRIEVSLGNVHLSPSQGFPDIREGEYLSIGVRDTGSGMTPDIMSRIFEPFFTTKELGKGTGMGLAVIHGIIKGHRGAITVESEAGKGSHFVVYLPLTGEGAHAGAREAVAVNDSKGKGKILLIDDEENVLKSVRKVLNTLGYEVVTGKSGFEAIDVFSKIPDRFDLVITDLTMPGMTGTELAGKLITIRPDIPVILCTGYSDDVNKRMAKDIGICGLLEKPADVGDLKQAICKALGHEPLTAQDNTE